MANRYGRSVLFCDELARAAAILGANTFSMAALNRCWAARYVPKDTRDIAGAYINWASVATPGTVQFRVETADSSSPSKASGSLYDAAATKDFTPVAGWQQVSFAVLPTTGLVVGTPVFPMMLTTVLGTTQTLNSHINPIQGVFPVAVQTASDGSVRTNLAETVTSTPVMTLVMEDGVEETFEFSPYSDSVASPSDIYLTRATAMSFPVYETALDVSGFVARVVRRIGTPAGDLRVRIFSPGDVAVPGSTLTLPRSGLVNVDQREIRANFAARVRLYPGVHKLVFDSASSANSSNCWRIGEAAIKNVSFLPASVRLLTTTDVTATPITWASSTTGICPAGLVLDDIVTVGGAAGRGRRRV